MMNLPHLPRVAKVSVAGLDVAEPTLLVNTARNCLPLSPTTVVKLYVVLVAPEMLDQPEPLFTCHCTEGVGLPVAAAVKEAVVRVCGEVLGATWTTRDGSRPIGVEDILVVAPYNRQVDLLTRVVPSGVRVGTVDRFQGQEAPVVIYSLAASEASEASRGVEFLLDLHRMNVAVSRARGLVVLTCSPRLLSTSCHSINEIRQVNALCAYVESAVEVGLPVLA